MKQTLIYHTLGNDIILIHTEWSKPSIIKPLLIIGKCAIEYESGVKHHVNGMHVERAFIIDIIKPAIQ